MRKAECAMRGDAMKTPSDMRSRSGGRNGSGFTLIEMMIVILLIVILSGMTFRMVSIMGRNNDVSRTRANLEKLGHALEEYRSAYGKYPEVKFYPIFEDSDGDGVSDNFVGIRQPVGYEYPMRTGFDENAAENTAKSLLNYDSNSSGPIRYGVTGSKYGIYFTFGLVSYLVPRYNGAAGSDDSVKWLCGYYTKNGKEFQDSDHALSQWSGSNDKPAGSSPGDPDRDLASSRRILAHLGSYLTDENEAADVSGYIVTVLGQHNDGRLRRVSGELKIVTNLVATVRDSWYHELRYRCLPPYDNYDLWSPGPDGKTVGDLCSDASHQTSESLSDGTHYKLKIGGSDVWFIGEGAPETVDDIYLGRD